MAAQKRRTTRTLASRRYASPASALFPDNVQRPASAAFPDNVQQPPVSADRPENLYVDGFPWSITQRNELHRQMVAAAAADAEERKNGLPPGSGGYETAIWEAPSSAQPASPPQPSRTPPMPNKPRDIPSLAASAIFPENVRQPPASALTPSNVPPSRPYTQIPARPLTPIPDLRFSPVQDITQNSSYRPPEYYQGLMQNNAELRGRQQAAAQANYDNLVQQQNQSRLDAQRSTGNFVSSAMASRPQTMADRLYGTAMSGGSVQSAVNDADRLALQPNRFGSATYTGPRSPAEADAMLNRRDLTRAQQMSAVASQQQAERQAQAIGMQDQLRQEMPQYQPGAILPSGNAMAFQTNNGGIGLIGRGQVRAIPGGIENSTFQDRRALVNRLANQNAGAQNEMTANARAAETQRKNQSIVSRAQRRGLDPRMTPQVAAAMEALGMQVPGSKRPQGLAQQDPKAPKPIIKSESIPNDINQIQQAEVSLYASPQFAALNIQNPHTMTDAQLETAIASSLDDPGIGPNLPEQSSEVLQEALKLRARRTGKKLPPRLQAIADGGVQGYQAMLMNNEIEREEYLQNNSFRDGIGF